MFDDRDNWIGIAILVLCGISAGTMLAYINRGEIAEWSGPTWLGNAIVAAGLALFVILTIQQVRAWRSRRGGGGSFLGNDTRPKRRWWKRD